MKRLTLERNHAACLHCFLELLSVIFKRLATVVFRSRNGCKQTWTTRMVGLNLTLKQTREEAEGSPSTLAFWVLLPSPPPPALRSWKVKPPNLPEGEEIVHTLGLLAPHREAGVPSSSSSRRPKGRGRPGVGGWSGGGDRPHPRPRTLKLRQRGQHRPGNGPHHPHHQDYD